MNIQQSKAGQSVLPVWIDYYLKRVFSQTS